MPEKNISRLIPVKKLVTNTKTGSINPQTYYVKPHENKKERPVAQGEEPNKGRTHSEQPEADAHHLNAEPIKGEHQPSEAEPLAKKGVLGEEGKLKTEDHSVDLHSTKDFEDFGKHGVDPKAARQFFCNM